MLTLSRRLCVCRSCGQLTYWDCYDGNAIRDVPGGTATLKALDVRPEGDLFACGGEDRVLRVRTRRRRAPATIASLSARLWRRHDRRCSDDLVVVVVGGGAGVVLG